jgi:hypothetical protein
LFNIKLFKDSDYDIVKSWWKHYDWPAVSLDVLPKTGFIIDNDEIPVAASWVIATNSPIYLLEWTVGNPDIDWELRSEGLQKLIEYCCHFCKNNGANFVFTMTKNKRLLEKLKNCNFKTTDEDMTHLLRSL